MRTPASLALLLVLFAAACAGDRHCRGIEPNGPRLSGATLVRPGTRDRCPARTALELQAVDLSGGVTLRDGRTLRDVALQGTTLQTDAAGADFSGAVMEGTAQDGRGVRLRLDERAPAAPGSEVWLYRVSYQFTDLPQSPWSPLCAEDARALPLAGRWDAHAGHPGDGGKVSSDPRTVTWACQGSALAKCAERIGYLPWQQRDGVSLDALHQACVRAVRADYCGDGVPWTVAGTRINLYDGLGIQRDEADWPLEAEWTPEGARCVARPRLDRVPGPPERRVRDYILSHCKERLAENGQCPAAATPPLIWTEAAPRK